MGEAYAGLVEDYDFPLVQSGAQFRGAHTVMLASGVHDGEAGQETQQVQPQMTLRGGFAPTVLRPRHAIGHQLDRRGVNDVDGAAEPPPERLVPPGRKPGVLGLQRFEHPPKEFFRQRAVTLLVRVTERVARRRRRPAHRAERRQLEPQGIAHLVEAKGGADLRIEHRHHVTPRAERTGPVINPALAREFRDEIGRNQFDELTQNSRVPAPRLRWFFLFHPCLLADKNHSAEPPPSFNCAIPVG